MKQACDVSAKTENRLFRPLMWLGIAFSAGCGAAHYLTHHALLLTALAALLFWKCHRFRALFLAGMTVGMIWYSGYHLLYLSPAEALLGQEETVILELTDYPEETDYGFRAEVKICHRPFRGKAVYYGDSSLAELVPGDKIRTTAVYQTATVLGHRESDYYTAQGVFVRLSSRGDCQRIGSCHRLRYLPRQWGRRLTEQVLAVFPQPAAGLLVSLLVGGRSQLGIPQEIALAETGLMHITAVSGLHCGFFVQLMGLLLGKNPRRMARLAYPVLLFYMVMVGMSPSVVRACIMMGFLLLAPLMGRESDSPTALAAAALAILLQNPFAVASVSFQLSFGAVAGLLLLSPRIRRALRFAMGKRREWKNTLIDSVSASLGASALTVPIGALVFDTLSLISPAANLLVLWCMPLLFMSGLGITVLTIPFPWLSPLAALPTVLADYVLWTTERLSALPFHAVYLTSPVFAVWLVLAMMLITLCALNGGRVRHYAALAILLAAGLLGGRWVVQAEVKDAPLAAVAVDVGQGAATLLSSGEMVGLIDCGSHYCLRGSGNRVADLADTYGWRTLHFVVLTHFHSDHANGLEELLCRVPVERLYIPQSDGRPDALREQVLSLARQYGVAVVEIGEMTTLPFGESTLTLYPPFLGKDVNEAGLTALVSCGDFDLLATGDMNCATERKLLDAYSLPDIEVYLAGHHGSRYASSEELLATLSPEVGIISVGENDYGHPAEDTLRRMAWEKMTLYRTDLQGDIIIRANP